MKIRFIGDIHQKLLDYLQVIDGVENSVQVGDFGMGFGTKGAADFVDSLIDEIQGNHRYIRGNHDSPEECKRSSHWIKDGTIENDIMYIGGAWSIDQEWRTEGINWWYDEELSYIDLDALVGIYDFIRPKVMVTHTAPIDIPEKEMGFRILGTGSRTELALQRMLDIHRPKIWVFGHWHRSFDKVIDGTRFICLNELEYIDLEI